MFTVELAISVAALLIAVSAHRRANRRHDLRMPLARARAFALCQCGHIGLDHGDRGCNHHDVDGLCGCLAFEGAN